jgi:beta-phosphoglucomutase-like phosphatase (HAD superfamily)
MYAALLDMDGVLADTEGLICEATIGMFQELYGVRMRESDFLQYVGTGAIRYVEGPAADYGIAIDTEAAIARRHENFVALLTSGRDIAFPGVRELLCNLRDDARWKMALATSTPIDTARVTLRAARIELGWFDAVMHGGLVTRKKPDPEIFLSASAACRVPATHCVVVEDAVTGVAAGKAALMKVLAVTNTFTREQLAGADECVPTLQGITPDRLERLLQA